MTAGFELVEHTADVAIRAWGDRPQHVFEQAARAMVSLIYDVEAVASQGERRIELGGSDLELTLAAWLNELLYLVEAERFLGHEFTVEELPGEDDGARLKAIIRGETDAAGRHGTRTVVKAATLHDLVVRRVGTGWEGHVLLDV